MFTRKTLFWILTIDLFLFAIIGINIFAHINADNRTFTISTLPVAPYHDVVVLGASVHTSGQVSPVLRERLDTAIMIANSYPVDRIYLAGDGQSETNNEVLAMQDYIAPNIPEHITLVLVPEGLDTNTSFRNILGPSPTTVVISQSFHLPRALLYCDLYHENCIGVQANNKLNTPIKQYIREFFATIKAGLIFIDVSITRFLWK